MKQRPGTERGEHQNAARAALMIETLADSKELGMRLTDVVEATGLGTATVHRLLAGLVTYGFVDHDPQSNRYFVGLRLVGWAAAATERYGLAPFADEALAALSLQSEDTVYFSLLSGFDSVCVDRREGSYPIKTLTLKQGDKRPLGIGGGSLAICAFQPDSFVEKLLSEDEERRKAYGFTNKLLKQEIKRVRELGFALVEGRLIEGMSGVGVPVRRRDGQAVAAVSIAAISSRLSGSRLDDAVGWLKDAARAIEEAAADILNTPLAKRHSHPKEK